MHWNPSLPSGRSPTGPILRRVGRSLAVVAMWAILLWMGLLQAAAQTPAPTLSVTPSQAVAGAFVKLSGAGFTGGQPVTVLWDGTPLTVIPALPQDGTFDLWVALPPQAPVGPHVIQVCSGSPCDGSAPEFAMAGFTVTATPPPVEGSLLFIYRNRDRAKVFAEFLRKRGFQVTLVSMADLPQVDVAPFDLVLIGPETTWNNQVQMDLLAKRPRILGLGEGGYAFFGQLGLEIGFPNGALLSPSDQVVLGDPQGLLSRVPYDLSSYRIAPIPLVPEAANVVAQHIDMTSTSTAVPLAWHPSGGKPSAYAPIVAQGCRVLWGFQETPDTLTEAGQALFVNTLMFALSVPCDFSVNTPCLPLTTPRDLPTPAVLDFDRLPLDSPVGDAYRASHGVRFQEDKAAGTVVQRARQAHSPPQVAVQDALQPERTPMWIQFERDQSHVGLWVGNGVDVQNQPLFLKATLTAYDRQNEPLCSTTISPVPESYDGFVGLFDIWGRIAAVALDYGDTATPESIDDLTLGLFGPANNVQVCRQDPGDPTCKPVANALVYRIPAEEPLGRSGDPRLPDRQPWAERLRTDANGYVIGRNRIRFGDRLWALMPIANEEKGVLYLTSGAPVTVEPEAFQEQPEEPPILQLRVSTESPLLVMDLVIAAQWNMAADPLYRQDLERNILLAANALYDFTDGQFTLGTVHVYQGYERWRDADVWLYASNNLRPRAVIGGILTERTPDPKIPGLRYYPGQIHMGATWNRFNVPGMNPVPNVLTQDDWGLALAHEAGHYRLFLFDTYLGIDEKGREVEVDTCVGSAMGWVYDTVRNSEFIADEAYWLARCANTLAHQILGRTEWATIQLWYPWVVPPSQVDPGPAFPPAPLTQVIFHPANSKATPLPNPVFRLLYQDNETASTEARAYILRDDRVIDQGRPIEGTTIIRLYGPQEKDRFCLFDITGPFVVDDPRHQWGCEILELGDNELQLKKDETWAPIITLSPVSTRTVQIQVVQPLTDGVLRAKLYPEHIPVPTEIALKQTAEGLWEGVFESPVRATAAYVQVWVDEPATETDPRRELIVDYGVGGSGLTGPFSRLGGVAVTSSDGNANYEITGTVQLAEGEFIALQLMAGRPPRPQGKRVVGRAYNLIAVPRDLAARGEVLLRLPSLAISQGDVQPPRDLKPTVHFWDGTRWQPLPSRTVTQLNGRRAVAAPSQGVGIYVLMVEEFQLQPERLYLPLIAR